MPKPYEFDVSSESCVSVNFDHNSLIEVKVNQKVNNLQICKTKSTFEDSSDAEEVDDIIEFNRNES